MTKNLRKSLIGIFALVLITICALVGITQIAPTAKADSSKVFEMNYGAEVRIPAANEDANGIRFQAKLDKTAYDEVFDEEGANKEGKSLGMLIVPVSYFDDYADYKAENSNYDGSYFEYFKEVKGKILFQEYESSKLVADGNDYLMKVALVDVLDTNFGLEFMALAYIRTTNQDVVSYEYADFNFNNARSMAYVAAQYMSDPANAGLDFSGMEEYLENKTAEEVIASKINYLVKDDLAQYTVVTADEPTANETAAANLIKTVLDDTYGTNVKIVTKSNAPANYVINLNSIAVEDVEEDTKEYTVSDGFNCYNITAKDKYLTYAVEDFLFDLLGYVAGASSYTVNDVKSNDLAVVSMDRAVDNVIDNAEEFLNIYECFDITCNSYTDIIYKSERTVSLLSFDGYVVLGDNIDMSSLDQGSGLSWRLDYSKSLDSDWASSYNTVWNDLYLEKDVTAFSNSGLIGTLDGRGHSVKGLKLASYGIFLSIGSTGVIKDIAFVDTAIDGGSTGLCADMYGKVDNVLMDVKDCVNDNGNTSAIGGRLSGATVSNTIVYSEVNKSGSGIVMLKVSSGNVDGTYGIANGGSHNGNLERLYNGIDAFNAATKNYNNYNSYWDFENYVIPVLKNYTGTHISLKPVE